MIRQNEIVINQDRRALDIEMSFIKMKTKTYEYWTFGYIKATGNFKKFQGGVVVKVLEAWLPWSPKAMRKLRGKRGNVCRKLI